MTFSAPVFAQQVVIGGLHPYASLLVTHRAQIGKADPRAILQHHAGYAVVAGTFSTTR